MEITAGAWHFTYVSWNIGIDFIKWGFPFASLIEPTDDNYLNSFNQYTNSIIKKVMYYRGKPSQRMLVKGHFLIATNTLQKRFPDARFFTVVRDPLEHFQSFINFIMIISADGPPSNELLLPPIGWKQVCEYVIYTQIPFCEQEMLFYDQSDDKKLAIPFKMYVNKLNDVLQTIYSFCNIPIPTTNVITTLQTTHDCTNRKASYNLKFNRSLSDLGIDVEKLKEHLTMYAQWLENLDKKLNL